MKARHGHSDLLRIASFILFPLIPPTLAAAPPAPRPGVFKDGEVVAAKGDGWICFTSENLWRDALIEQTLTAGDTLKTGTHGKLDVLFIDGTKIKIHMRTVMLIKRVRKPAEQKGTLLNLMIGEIWSRAKSTPESLRIETPSVTAAIRGTDWDLAVDEKGASYLTVLAGAVDLSNGYGQVSVGAGEQAMAEVGKPPVKMFLVRPKDRVQWIISYPLRIPRLMAFSPTRGAAGSHEIEQARERIRKDRTDGGAKLAFAALLFDRGQYAECRRLLDEIIQADPDHGRANVMKGMLLLDAGHAGAASACFERASRDAHSASKLEAQLGLAGVALQKNEISRAEAILHALGETDDTALVGVARASFLAFQGRFREAAALCTQYAIRHPQDERFPVLAAEFLLVLDEPDQAVASLDRARSLNPDSSKLHTVLGRAHYLEGRGQEAEKAYRRAVALRPGDEDALSELGRLLMERGEFEEATGTMNKAVAQDPQGSIHVARRGMLLNWLQEIGRARADFSAALQLNPADYQSLDGLGFLALKAGRREEAIRYFDKASTLEPRHAEPHVFLAIAHYQREEIAKAFEELRLAETLDPKDPLPHVVAHIIYQDTYRPFAAIRSAQRALEQLPYLKSVNPIEKTQQGISNLGSALLGLGMTEWATSYAEESFDPFEASGYHFLAKKHEGNPAVYVSERTQGFLLDPLSLGYHSRFQDIVPRPHHDLRIHTRIGDDGGGFSRDHTITQQGYMRGVWELKYLLDFENMENRGFRPNGGLRQNLLTFALGAKPNYQNGLILFGGFNENAYGDPGPATADFPANDRNRSYSLILNAGYNHRFGNKNNLLFNFRHSRTRSRYQNPDPYGTGLTNAQLSILQAFGAARARAYFAQGVYDVTRESLIMGPWSSPYFATDSTGELQRMSARGEGVTAVPAIPPTGMDPNWSIRSDGLRSGYTLQIKHLMQAWDRHQISWGIEYSPVFSDLTLTSRSLKQSDRAWFREEYALWGNYFFPATYFRIPYVQSEEATDILNQDTRFSTVYFHDRWRLSSEFQLDAGLYHERFSNELNRFGNFCPRIGFAWRVHPNHVIRAASQRRTLEASEMTLAPVTTAGLFFDWILLMPGARIADHQAALESRWSERIYTQLGWEIREHTMPEVDGATFARRNRTQILTASCNAILSDTLGMYSRYKYTEDRNREGSFMGNRTPLVPRHSASAGLVCVLPQYVKASLAANHAAMQFGDDANTLRRPAMLTADFSTTWEPLKKRFMFQLEIKNIFDQRYETQMSYPAAGRSAYLSVEYRF